MMNHSNIFLCHLLHKYIHRMFSHLCNGLLHKRNGNIGQVKSIAFIKTNHKAFASIRIFSANVLLIRPSLSLPLRTNDTVAAETFNLFATSFRDTFAIF